MLTSSKGCIQDNLKALEPMIIVLKAMAYGFPITMSNREYEMQDGRIYIAGRIDAYGKSWQEQVKHYIGYSNICSIDGFVLEVEEHIKNNPKFIEELKFEIASKAVLNNLPSKF